MGHEDCVHSRCSPQRAVLPVRPLSVCELKTIEQCRVEDALLKDFAIDHTDNNPQTSYVNSRAVALKMWCVTQA